MTTSFLLVFTLKHHIQAIHFLRGFLPIYTASNACSWVVDLKIWKLAQIGEKDQLTEQINVWIDYYTMCINNRLDQPWQLATHMDRRWPIWVGAMTWVKLVQVLMRTKQYLQSLWHFSMVELSRAW